MGGRGGGLNGEDVCSWVKWVVLDSGLVVEIFWYRAGWKTAFSRELFKYFKKFVSRW